MFNFSALQEVSNILQAAQEASENVLEEVSNTVEAAQTSSANVLQEVSDTLQEHQASSTQMEKKIHFTYILQQDDGLTVIYITSWFQYFMGKLFTLMNSGDGGYWDFDITI